jgi:hypothetical protein
MSIENNLKLVNLEERINDAREAVELILFQMSGNFPVWYDEAHYMSYDVRLENLGDFIATIRRDMAYLRLERGHRAVNSAMVQK